MNKKSINDLSLDLHKKLKGKLVTSSKFEVKDEDALSFSIYTWRRSCIQLFG
jgi:hypothetical protein